MVNLLQQLPYFLTSTIWLRALSIFISHHSVCHPQEQISFSQHQGYKQIDCIIKAFFINNIMESTYMATQYEEDQSFEEYEDLPAPICRICFEEGDNLISPCQCSGNLAHVHPNCLAKQIETARIMRVAEVDGFYNSRCQLCKFRIQFKIQEKNCVLNRQGIKQAISSLDEDSVASLGLNLTIAILLCVIILITVFGHIHAGLYDRWNINFKIIFLSVVLLAVEYFLIQNVLQRLPRKIKKPVLITIQ